MTQSRCSTPVAEDGFAVDCLHSRVAAEAFDSLPSSTAAIPCPLQSHRRSHVLGSSVQPLFHLSASMSSIPDACEHLEAVDANDHVFVGDAAYSSEIKDAVLDTEDPAHSATTDPSRVKQEPTKKKEPVTPLADRASKAADSKKLASLRFSTAKNLIVPHLQPSSSELSAAIIKARATSRADTSIAPSLEAVVARLVEGFSNDESALIDYVRNCLIASGATETEIADVETVINDCCKWKVYCDCSLDSSYLCLSGWEVLNNSLFGFSNNDFRLSCVTSLRKLRCAVGNYVRNLALKHDILVSQDFNCASMKDCDRELSRLEKRRESEQKQWDAATQKVIDKFQKDEESKFAAASKALAKAVIATPKKVSAKTTAKCNPPAPPSKSIAMFFKKGDKPAEIESMPPPPAIAKMIPSTVSAASETSSVISVSMKQKAPLSRFLPWNTPNFTTMAPHPYGPFEGSDKRAFRDASVPGELSSWLHVFKACKIIPALAPVAVEQDESGDSGGVTLRKRLIHHASVMVAGEWFDARRPAYYGVVLRSAPCVTAKTPFAQDKSLDYDFNSEDEWSDEEDGETINSCDEDEEVDDEYDLDDGFIDDEFNVGKNLPTANLVPQVMVHSELRTEASLSANFAELSTVWLEMGPLECDADQDEDDKTVGSKRKRSAHHVAAPPEEDVTFSGFRESGAKPIEKRFGPSLGAATNIKRDQTKQKKQQSKTKGLKKQMKENAEPSQTKQKKQQSKTKGLKKQVKENAAPSQTKQKKQQSKTKGLKNQVKENAAPSQTSGFKLPSTLKFEQRLGKNQCQLTWNVPLQQRAVSVSDIHQRMMSQPDFNQFESESIRNGNVAFDGHHRGSSQPLPPTFREQQL